MEARQGPSGRLEAIEITVSPGAPEKRVIRDVESALLSGLGLRIDHRAIHVRRPTLGEGVVLHYLEPRAGDAAAPKSLSAQLLLHPRQAERRIRLESVRCDLDGKNYCEVTVELGLDGAKIQGTAREVDTLRGRILATGRATLNAIDSLLEEEVAIALEGIEEFSTWEAKGLLVLLRVRRNRMQKDFCGAVLVDSDPLEATARAVLNASNRFLEGWEAGHDPYSGERTGTGGRF